MFCRINYRLSIFKTRLIILILLLIQLYGHDIFASTTVAGCDNVGWYCDISWKLDKRQVYAPKISVWTEAESQANIDVVKGLINTLRNEQVASRDQAVDTLNTTIRNQRAEIDASIRRERQRTNAVRDEIRNSLRGELQRLLLAQTCEDQEIPAVGARRRAAKVTARIDCIRTALNNWRGVDAEGRRIVVAEGNALSREQVAQMIRFLELIQLDVDTSPAQRQFIANTLEQFVFFNLM